MALRKEPERRYASVGLLSEDIRRHLAGLPVLAHKDTTAYRAAKFVRRHRGAVVAAILVFFALLGGVVVANWQARIARQAQVKAETARKQADRLNQFLEDLMSSADPAKMGKDGKVVPMLDAAGEKLDHELADEPEILARAHETLRRAYQHLGIFDRAEAHARAALALVRRLHGPDAPATARAESHLADVLSDRYRPQEAEPLLRHALAVEREQPEPNDGDLADTLETLSFIYATEKRPGDAEKVAQEAVSHARAAWGEQDQRFLRVLNEMGNIQIAKGDYAAAAPIYRRLILLNDKVQPGGLGSIAPQINLCISLFNLEKFAELEPAVNRLLGDTNRLVGEHGLPTAIALAVRGCLEFAKGDYAAAIPPLRQALDILPNNYPPGQTSVVQCRVLLGLCLTRTGHAVEGEPLLRQALADGGKVDRAEFAHTVGNLETALGECLLAQDREAEAGPLLLAGYNDLKARLGDKNPLTIKAAGRLRTLHQGKIDSNKTPVSWDPGR
jgi:tetratricopeptide (TPR) repeat protein